MSFTPKSWGNFQSGGTPLNAAGMVDLEVRLSDYSDSVGGGGMPATSAGIRYVSGTGSDSASGLAMTVPKRTIQAAYADLPATGGVIWAMPGRYDCSPFAITRGKTVALRGTNPPPPYLGSTQTAPVGAATQPGGVNCAVIYTSTGVPAMITTTTGTAATQLNGVQLHDLLFEFSDADTLWGIDAWSVQYLKMSGCYGFADKTSGSPGPANVAAALCFVHSETGWGTIDSSWSRVWHNNVVNMALGVWGNSTGSKLSANQHVIKENVGLGLNHATTTCLPFISIYGGHRCVVRDNNAESYNRFLLVDTCWDFREDGNGGENTDIWIDLVNCKGVTSDTLGISWAPLAGSPFLPGATTYRGDAFTKASRLYVPTWTSGNTQRMKPPTDDATNPQAETLQADNIMQASRYSTDFMDVGATSTTTPGAVSTVNIAHGLGVAPLVFQVQAGNTNARGAPAFSVTADATNVILSFASNLTAATSYAWNWTARR